jgi:hypothetical protein
MNEQGPTKSNINKFQKRLENLATISGENNGNITWIGKLVVEVTDTEGKKTYLDENGEEFHPQAIPKR